MTGEATEPEDDTEVSYAEVASAMEAAFLNARAQLPHLTEADLLIALLLLKDRIIEQHLKPDELPPELVALARKLHSI